MILVFKEIVIYYCIIVCVLFIIINLIFFWYLGVCNFLCYFLFFKSVFGFLNKKLYFIFVSLGLLNFLFLIYIVENFNFCSFFVCFFIIDCNGVMMSIFEFGINRGMFLYIRDFLFLVL